MKRLSEVWKTFRRYALIGVFSNLVCYAVFLMLISSNVRPVVSNTLCYMLGLALSYGGNRRWTYASSNSHKADALRFAGAYAIGLLTSASSIVLLTRVIPVQIAQICCIVLSAIVIFGALQVFRFGRSSPAACSTHGSEPF